MKKSDEYMEELDKSQVKINEMKDSIFASHRRNCKCKWKFRDFSR